MNPGSALPLLLFFGFTAGIVALALTLALKQQRRAREQLTALAARLGLELKRQPAKLGFEPTPTVEGNHRGRFVRFFSFTTGSGKSRTTWVAVSAAATGTGAFTLDLGHENFLTRMAIALGMQDIKVGDPAFDRAFIVKSSDPAYAAAALLPEIRARLLAGVQHGMFGHLRIADGLVRYAETGAFGNEAQLNRLVAMLEVACDLAEVAEVYPKK